MARRNFGSADDLFNVGIREVEVEGKTYFLRDLTAGDILGFQSSDNQGAATLKLVAKSLVDKDGNQLIADKESLGKMNLKVFKALQDEVIKPLQDNEGNESSGDPGSALLTD